MSEREVSLLIADMILSVEKIQAYTSGYNYEQYVNDSKTTDAVERNFEIIGEAASRVPDAYKQLNPGIEWRLIKDFRNFLIHEYFGINNQIIWDTIQFRLNDLKHELLQLLAENHD